MNWGNKLILVFLVFAAGMAFMVYKAVNTNFELVEKDYYKQELRYQEVIDGKAAAANLSSLIELKYSREGILLIFPQEAISTQPVGEVMFYCANDAKRDRKFALTIDKTGKQFFSSTTILPGNYKVKISWTMEEKKYYVEKDILVP